MSYYNPNNISFNDEFGSVFSYVGFPDNYNFYLDARPLFHPPVDALASWWDNPDTLEEAELIYSDWAKHQSAWMQDVDIVDGPPAPPDVYIPPTETIVPPDDASKLCVTFTTVDRIVVSKTHDEHDTHPFLPFSPICPKYNVSVTQYGYVRDITVVPYNCDTCDDDYWETGDWKFSMFIGPDVTSDPEIRNNGYQAANIGHPSHDPIFLPCRHFGGGMWPDMYEQMHPGIEVYPPPQDRPTNPDNGTVFEFFRVGGQIMCLDSVSVFPQEIPWGGGLPMHVAWKRFASPNEKDSHACGSKTHQRLESLYSKIIECICAKAEDARAEYPDDYQDYLDYVDVPRNVHGASDSNVDGDEDHDVVLHEDLFKPTRMGTTSDPLRGNKFREAMRLCMDQMLSHVLTAGQDFHQSLIDDPSFPDNLDDPDIDLPPSVANNLVDTILTALALYSRRYRGLQKKDLRNVPKDHIKAALSRQYVREMNETFNCPTNCHKQI